MIGLTFSLNSCQQGQTSTGEPTSEISEFVNSWISSLNDRNVEKLVSLYEENASIEQSNGWKDTGTEAIRKHFLGNIESFPDLKIVPKSVKMAGNHVFVFYHASGTDNGRGIEKNPPTGRAFKDLPLLTCLHIENGKILDEQLYLDHFTWKKQLGYKMIPPTIEDLSMD